MQSCRRKCVKAKEFYDWFYRIAAVKIARIIFSARAEFFFLFNPRDSPDPPVAYLAHETPSLIQAKKHTSGIFISLLSGPGPPMPRTLLLLVSCRGICMEGFRQAFSTFSLLSTLKIYKICW